LGDKKSKNLSKCNTTHKTLSNFTCHPVYPHYLLSLVANCINFYPLYGFLFSNKSQVVQNKSLGARIRIQICKNPVKNRIRIRIRQNPKILGFTQHYYSLPASVGMILGIDLQGLDSFGHFGGRARRLDSKVKKSIQNRPRFLCLNR
jgi:hypothetical protein